LKKENKENYLVITTITATTVNKLSVTFVVVMNQNKPIPRGKRG